MESPESDPRTSNPQSGESARRPLSAREAEAVTAALADVTAAELPLADGLRAAADEAADRRVADELSWLASQVEAGRPLDEVLASRQAGYPGYAGGVVRAALRTGRLGEALVDLVGCQRTRRDMWWSIRVSLSYPLLLLVVATLIGAGIAVGLLGPLVDLFLDSEMDLPYMTRALVWFHQSGVKWVLGLAGAVVAAAILFRLVAGAAPWRRVVSTVPVVGVLWHWSGVAELARLLAALVEYGVPLPESLRLAAAAVRDANLSQVSLGLATEVERGRSLSELIAVTPRMPASLGPLVRWGERAGQLDEAFRVAAEMFEGRLQLRAELVRSILPPLVFVAVASGVFFLLASLYLPLVAMIQGLS
jgi:type II secretory pathway component PulF